MKPVARGPWTISIGTPDAGTFKVHHCKNYIPEEHSLHDLIQLSRLIRTAEKWARKAQGLPEAPLVLLCCPKCGGPIVDLRGAGFSAEAMKRQGTCVWWAEDQYNCARSR